MANTTAEDSEKPASISNGGATSLPLVIVNPASGGGATRSAWPRMASDLRRHFGPFDCVFTERAGDAIGIAESEARGGRHLIVACGGDGTISEVANGILRSGEPAELGLLPSGTGGDLRRTLRVPASASGAARALKEGKTRRMDVGRVTFLNDGGVEESRCFLNTASFGMSGAVLERMTGAAEEGTPARLSRVLGGRFRYAVAAVQVALSFSKPSVNLRLDDKPEVRHNIVIVCVANGQYFGGGMKIAPAAKVNDGKLDVVVVGDLSMLGMLANSYRLYLGSHLTMEQVKHAHARSIRIDPAEGCESVRVEVDGEITGSLPVLIDILPDALSVRSPS